MLHLHLVHDQLIRLRIPRVDDLFFHGDFSCLRTTTSHLKEGIKAGYGYSIPPAIQSSAASTTVSVPSATSSGSSQISSSGMDESSSQPFIDTAYFEFRYGDPDDYPYGLGPQGDVIAIFNYVRCVRGGL